MTEIRGLLDSEDVLIGLAAESREDAIAQMVAHLARRGWLLDEEACLRDVMAHEGEMATGLTDGIAIPHAKTEAVREPRLTVAQFAEPLEWETIDGSDVEVAILITVPKERPGTHLEVLAQLAERLMGEGACARLRQAGSAEEVIQTLEG